MPSSSLEDSQITFGCREHVYFVVISCHFFNRKSRHLGLDVTSGKVTIGGDGSNTLPFTSRPDIARYLSYVLTHLPADQLKNRSFTITGDTKVRATLICCLDAE
jgi:hypothetical protein